MGYAVSWVYRLVETGHDWESVKAGKETAVSYVDESISIKERVTLTIRAEVNVLTRLEEGYKEIL